MPWLAVANSFCEDYLVRKKVALHVSLSVLDSLPFPRLSLDHPVVDRLARLALRLTCTSPEMTGYWNAMADHGLCEAIAEDRYSARLRGPRATGGCPGGDRCCRRPRICSDLSADELADILDTFPVLRRREEKRYGEFRTKRLVLEWYGKV